MWQCKDLLPFDNVSPSRFLVFSDHFDFVLFFSFDKVRWRFLEVGSVDLKFHSHGTGKGGMRGRYCESVGKVVAS